MEQDDGFSKFSEALRMVHQAGKDPEKLEKLLRKAIKTNDNFLFTNASLALQRHLNVSEKDIWRKVLESGNTEFLKKRALSINTDMQSIRSLQQAFMEYATEGKRDKSFLQKVKFIIQDARAAAYSKNLKGEVNIVFINKDAPQGDFPNITINTPDIAFCFCGLSKKQIEQKGFVPYLKELFEEYEQQYLERYDNYRKIATSNDDSDLNPQATAEMLCFYYPNKKPSEIIGAEEFERANQAAQLCFDLSKTNAAPLLDLFIRQGKSLAINTDGFAELGGLYIPNAIALNNTENISTLHHELIHNADATLKFTQTPVFKSLYEYCESTADISFIQPPSLQKDFWTLMNRYYRSYQKNAHIKETPAFLASVSYLVPNNETHTEIVLDFISAYVKAHMRGNKKEKMRLEKALQNKRNIHARYDPIRYLESVLHNDETKKQLRKARQRG